MSNTHFTIAVGVKLLVEEMAVSAKTVTTHTLVKGVALLKLWLKSINANLKSVAVLGDIYFLMSSSDLDDICQWVTNKRSYFHGKQSSLDALL